MTQYLEVTTSSMYAEVSVDTFKYYWNHYANKDLAYCRFNREHIRKLARFSGAKVAELYIIRVRIADLRKAERLAKREAR